MHFSSTSSFDKFFIFWVFLSIVLINVTLFVLYKKNINYKSPKVKLFILLGGTFFVLLPFLLGDDLSLKSKITLFALGICVGILNYGGIKGLGTAIGRIIKPTRTIQTNNSKHKGDKEKSKNIEHEL